MKPIENQQIPMRIDKIQWKLLKSDEISENTRSLDELAMTLPPSNRCTECPNTRKSIENEFYMKKYIEAMVWKTSQLPILTEIHYFENYSRV